MFGLFKFFNNNKVDSTNNADDIVSRDDDIIDGKTTDETNLSAPKTIESTELKSFRASFFRLEDDCYEESREYHFKMDVNENGTYVISEESGDDKLACETDIDFAIKLDEIIREYDLIASNGISKVTAGLPPEYAPWRLNALYASGEKLSIYEDGDPTADWTRAILDLFTNEFYEHGMKF